jgi:hypothetical protein
VVLDTKKHDKDTLFSHKSLEYHVDDGPYGAYCPSFMFCILSVDDIFNPKCFEMLGAVGRIWVQNGVKITRIQEKVVPKAPFRVIF